MNSYPIKCSNCGEAHSQKQWHTLPYLGVMLDCLELRQCVCGDTLSVEIEGFGGANDHEGAVRNCEAL